jgi:hypothetical protein
MIKVGIRFTSSNVFAKKALRNHKRLKRLAVKRTNKNHKTG